MSTSLLFIIDPWDTLKVYKDSSLAMMRVALTQGIRVFVGVADALTSAEGEISALVHELTNGGTVAGAPIAVHPTGVRRPLASFSAVIMRKDPPFDDDYISALWLLRAAQRQGAKVVNDPTAVLAHNEKLSILEFAQHTPPTVVSRDPIIILDFWRKEGDIVVKPLNGMGGRGIFRLREGEINANAILESFAGAPIMAQTYLPAIREGDKRVFILGGKVQPFALARIPMMGETRGNLAAGGKGVATPLTHDELTVANAIAPIVQSRGLIVVGLDMIGGRLTEMNVTSPTCMVEIEAQTGYPVAEHALSAMLAG